MEGWHLYYDLKYNIILSRNKKSLWKIEIIEDKKFYIKDALYGFYLCLSNSDQRDYYSFYGTGKKEIVENNKNLFIFSTL